MNRWIFVTLGCFAGSAFAAVPPAVEQRVQAFERGLLPRVLVAGEKPATTALLDRMTELKVPGVSVAVIHRGRIDWARGYGVTRTGGAPVTDRTLFQAASISKPVFALAILHLVDQGKLPLDGDVNERLKSWSVPDNAFTKSEKVTPRRLLSHSAGLTVHGFRGYAAGEKLPTDIQVLDGEPPANSSPVRVDVTPGSVIRYSGGGYTVAQLLLHEVTGQPVPKFMRETVLEPLGMTLSTYEQPLPAARMGEVALPYRDDGTPVAGGPHTYPEMAAAGLWTTPSDLARYALGVRDALAGKSKVISAATARTMLTAVRDTQGIGPQVGGGTSRKFFMHNGGNEGYRCVLVAYEDGEGAVVMTNGDNGGGLMYEVLHTLASVYEWPDFAPAKRSLAKVKPEVLDRLLGVYELGDKSIYVVRRDGARLVGNLIGDVPLVLSPSAEKELFAREVDVLATFSADSNGAITGLKHRVNGYERSGVRVDETRSRRILATIDRDRQRIKDQKADPRSEAAARKLIAGLTSGKPDYDSLSPQLAGITRAQISGLQGWFTGMGELKSLTFQRVTESGADEYLAEFVNANLRIDVGLDDDGRVDKFFLD